MTVVDVSAFQTTKITVEARVPTKQYESWIKDFALNQDVFRRSYCGYWLRAIEYDNALGWLVWEDDDNKSSQGHEPDRRKAFRAWRDINRGCGPLPPRYHRLDRAAAERAYAHGVRLWGENWDNGPHGDSTGYDVVIQHALLGEVRYG